MRLKYPDFLETINTMKPPTYTKFLTFVYSCMSFLRMLISAEKKICTPSQRLQVIALILTLLTFCFHSTYGQTIQTFNSSGTFTVPFGVQSIIVECWGGGGAGGGNSAGSNGGGGGGGGAYSKTILTGLIRGTVYSYNVGTGGLGSTGNGASGGDTWFQNSTSILAKGGGGGFTPANQLGGIFGPGGASASSIGTPIFAGGSGGSGRKDNAGRGGPGGSSAGTTSNGTSGPTPWSTELASLAPADGGKGGNGGLERNPGSIGVSPGGGGGGAGDQTNSGGNGAPGQVRITYTPLTYKSQITSITTGSTNWCAGETRNVTVTVKNIGTATWTDTNPDINIGVKWNTNGASWADYYVRVDAGNLAPGATATYTLPVRASDNAGAGYTTDLTGSNNFTFDVIYEGLSSFGINTGGFLPGNAATVSTLITVNTLPVVTTASTVCAGSTITLSPTTGGSWASSNTSVATVDNTGKVTGVSGGTAAFTFISSSTGCSSVTPSLTVNPAIGIPNFSLGTTSARCQGAESVTYAATSANATGITYTLDAGSIAAGNSISSAGLVTYTSAYIGVSTVTAMASGCSGPRSSTHIVMSSVPGTWTGAVSTNWNLATNWACGIIPTSATNLTLPTGLTRYPVLSSDSGSVNNITLPAGTSLTVTNAILKIAGAVNNLGTFDIISGTIEMNGTVNQTIPANAFTGNSIKNLLINNDVALSGALSLTGTLTIGTTNKTLSTNNLLTLKSTATTTASVAALPVDASGVATSFITGNVTVERFIPDNRAWRLLTSPLSNTGSIFNAWQNGGVAYTAAEIGKGTLITGPNPTSANGLDVSALNSVSMKTYNANQTWGNITDTKSTNLSNNNGNADNIGYFVFVRGDRNPLNTNAGYSSSTTLSSTGKLQTGRQTITPASATSYSLIGNPYASPIDFSKVLLTNVAKRFYVWDATVNTVGAYVVVDGTNGTYQPTPSGPAQNQYIQSSQAIFVQSDPSAGTHTLVFDESIKTNQTSILGFRPIGVKSLAVTLNLSEADNSVQLADGTLAEFDDNYCKCVNIEDAIKFTNTKESFSFLRNGTALAIERWPLIKATDTLYLKLTGTSQRNYQLVIAPANLSQPGLFAYLQDKYTGVDIPVSLENATIYNFVINANAGSMATDRFKLVFKQGVVLPVTYSDVKALLQGNNIAVQWTVENQLNIQSYEVEKSVDGIHFTNVARQLPKDNQTTASYYCLDIHPVAGDNFYRIRNIDLSGATGYSKVVKVNTGNLPGEIAVYPNPVTGGKINLQLNNMPQGKYAVRLLSPGGQELLAKEINHAGGTAAENILLPKHISKGMYTLEITIPGKYKSTISVMNQ
ncbi:MAG: type sorting protein [Ferruginibacter sp.]|nr:type sorting protein [Ferruginibacter sp.]